MFREKFLFHNFNFSSLFTPAVPLNRYFRMCNYKGFLCTIGAEASNLQYCILEPYVNEVIIILKLFLSLDIFIWSSYPWKEKAKGISGGLPLVKAKEIKRSLQLEFSKRGGIVTKFSSWKPLDWEAWTKKNFPELPRSSNTSPLIS